MARGEDLNKENVAVGSLILAVGLVVCMFGAAHVAVYLPLMGTVSQDMLAIIIIGVLMVAGGIYTCIAGATRS